MRKYLISILALQLITLFFIIGARTEAATSWVVHNDEPLTLKNTILAAQTSNIVFIGAFINGEYQTFATQSGGILELVNPGRTKKELIYYSSATVDQTVTTKNVTLSGVVRGYCANDASDANTFAACAASKTYIWPRGTKGTLSPDMRLFNMTVKRDLPSYMIGRGQITGTASLLTQAAFNLVSFTTTQRNLWTSISDGDIWYDSTIGQVRARIGGSDATLGGSGTTNAGFGNSGKIQLPTPVQVYNSTASGSTGAPLVVAVKDVVTNSGSTASIGATSNVVATSGATIHPSLTGSGARNGTKFLRDDGDWKTVPGTTLGIDNVFLSSISNVSATSFTAISATLTGTIDVSVGDLLHMTLTIPSSAGGSACGLVNYDFGIGGGVSSSGTSQGWAGVSCSSAITTTISIYHKTLTGGTLIIVPTYKVDTNQATFPCQNSPCRFQVTH